MAPEEAGGDSKHALPATDVYAVVSILYEVLTVRPVCRAESAVDTLVLVRTQDPVQPTRLRPRLPRDLETICLKCLHKTPSHRYASAHHLTDDLGRFLQGK